MIKVYGASDDLICVEGDINEEFNVYDVPAYLMISNGALLSIECEIDGCWRIRSLFYKDNVAIKTCEYDPDNDDEYSDVATINEDIKWVMFAKKENVELISK